MEPTALQERLRLAAGGRSYRELADLTDTPAETVRRYMSGQAPSIEFVQAMCRKLGISAEWLLTGRGPIKLADLRAEALRDASAGELLSAVADTLEKLLVRVERLEVFLQTMETRLRAGRAASDGQASPDGSTRAVPVLASEGFIDVKPDLSPPDAGPRGIADAVARAARETPGGAPPPGGR